MRNAVLIVIICFLLSIPSLAFCQASSAPQGWSGNVNLFLGAKFLEDDDWEPVDDHLEGGIEFDFTHSSLPLSFAVDLLYSRDDEDIDVAVLGFGTSSVKAVSQTAEVNVGVRKIWEDLGYVRPFIGGGLAIIDAELETTELGVSVSDDDTELGVWIDAGMYFTLGQPFNMGIEGRWSKSQVELLGVEGKAGGWHCGALVGFPW